MHCPTCSSPLPDGAMFCGQCGRAISGTDWAAFRRDRAAASAAERSAEVAPASRPENGISAPSSDEPDAAWTLRRPPAAAVPAGTPWWVSEAPQDASGRPTDDTDDHETPASSAASEWAGTPASAPEVDASGDGASSDRAEGTRATISEPAVLPAAELAPAPLRPPGSVGGDGRPASVPLWTASLTPITDAERDADAVQRAPQAAEAEDERTEDEATEDETSEDEGTEDERTDLDARERDVSDADAEADADADEADTVSASEATQDPETPETPVSHEAGEHDAHGSRSVVPAPAARASAVSAPTPLPGDTNVIPPLVAPGAVLADGVLHCTVCGAALSDDDIFCGECGTVVQSVAQSFTGPITPILTGIVPTAAAPEVRGGEEATSQPEPRVSDPEPPTGAPRPAPLAPTPVVGGPALPPFVAEPDQPKPKKRRLFGRRPAEETPKLWSSPASGPAVPTPESPSAATPSPAIQPADVPGVVSGEPSSASAAASAAAERATPVRPVPPPVRADEVPAAPEPQPDEPVSAPLAATPVEVLPQSAEPVVAPLPAAPVDDRPAAPWIVNLGAAADDVESTRIVRRQPLGDPYVLQFSTGESFTVQGTGLVGRAPAPQPGEAIDLLVRIVDPGRSVSKTHLEFGQDDGTLWVSDRWSGNGSVVRAPSEAPRRVEPGKRVRVPRGSRVEIGEQFFIVN